jgi:hypothetical protein
MIVSLGACLLTGFIACATLAPREATAATLSWRFAGLEALKGKTNLVVFRDITGLKEFEGFRSNLTERIAQTLAQHATRGGTNAELVNLLRPMAADLVAYESLFERGAEGSNICALAVKLPPARHDIWKKNWDPILKTVKVEGATLSREGDWTLVTNGKSKKLLDRARESSKEILELEGDASALGDMYPGLSNGKGSLRVEPKGNGLRSEGKIKFEKDLALHLSPWLIPTNTIREPLIAFTAVQGMSDFLAKQPGFKKHPAPNQLFFWGEGLTPFSINAAVRVDNPKTFIRDFVDDFLPLAKSKSMIGNLEMDTNRNELFWRNLPLALPFLRPAHSNDVNFVYAGLWPLSEFGTNRMPAELATEVTSRTNLVYYDWELSGARIQQWEPLFQVLPMMLNQPYPTYTGPAFRWLVQAQEKLQNTITEVTQTGPRELTFVRRSDMGLSSLELYQFVRWVAGPTESATLGIAPRAPGGASPAPKR